jgi:hypothetical protein
MAEEPITAKIFKKALSFGFCERFSRSLSSLTKTFGNKLERRFTVKPETDKMTQPVNEGLMQRAVNFAAESKQESMVDDLAAFASIIQQETFEKCAELAEITGIALETSFEIAAAIRELAKEKAQI